MSTGRLRRSARALVLDPDNRVLLCRFVFTRGPDEVVWAPPGGGVEPGETLPAALRRELREEIGLRLSADPPHVWHQVVWSPDYAPGYAGVCNEHFLVRTPAFVPHGELTDAQLAAENMVGTRWWPLAEILAYAGTDRFSPRDLGRRLTELLRLGPPATPIPLGL